MDVLSNLPFAVLGIWGLRRLHWLDRAHEQLQDAARCPRPRQPPVNALDCAWMFFAGLVLTALGSAFYHLQPDDLRLAADRAGMAVAFAGLIGFAVCERVSAARRLAGRLVHLGGGLLAAAVCQPAGNALPWALVQFGGMALVLALALTRPVAGAIGLKLGWVIVLLRAGQAVRAGRPRDLRGHAAPGVGPQPQAPDGGAGGAAGAARVAGDGTADAAAQSAAPPPLTA